MPLKEKLFQWTTLRNRCWTGTRLAAKGLQGPTRCLLRDQSTKTIDHLMVQCPTSRSIWFQLFSEVGVQQFVLQVDSNLRGWWSSLTRCQPKARRKGLATLSIACCRRLWLERNDRYFDRKQATEELIVNRVRAEFQTWNLARLPAVSRELRGIG